METQAKQTQYLVGNYFMISPGRWCRFRDLDFLTRQWDSMNSDRTYGGGLTTRERDNYLKTGTCCDPGCKLHFHRWPELNRVHGIAQEATR